MPRRKKRHRRWYDTGFTPTDPRLWLYGPVPPGFWKSAENRHLYLDWLGERLGIAAVEDWYRVTYKDFVTHRGAYLWDSFGRSLLALLKDYRPHHNWLEWKFSQVSARFWAERTNRHRYLDWLGRQLGFRRIEDWYQIKERDFTQWYGWGLLAHFGNSPSAILKDYRPDYEWLEWRFHHVPLGFWHKRTNRRRYLTWVGKQLGFQKREDWYQLSQQHLQERHGSRLLAQFGHSPCAIVQDTWPQVRWLEWRFRQVRQGFWDDPANRHRYLRWFGKQVGFRRTEEWYQLTKPLIAAHDGGGLLAHFGDSPSALLKDYRPEYAWLEWRFLHVPQGFWNDPRHRQRYMDWLGQQLGIRQIEDWYQLSYETLTKWYGWGLLSRFGDSPVAVLKDYRPDYDWKEWLFRRPAQGFWATPANRRRYLDWLGQQLGFQRPEDWVRLRSVDLSRNRGQGLYKRFHNQIPRIVKEYLAASRHSGFHGR